MCPHKVSLNIKFEGSNWKNDSRNAKKLPKSHDQLLCAYWMRYDAHIQSHPRSSPKWYIYRQKLKSDEKNSSYHPDIDGDGQTDGRTHEQGESSTQTPPPPPPQLRCGGIKALLATIDYMQYPWCKNALNCSKSVTRNVFIKAII